jgi:hypothetical protein
MITSSHFQPLLGGHGKRKRIVCTRWLANPNRPRNPLDLIVCTIHMNILFIIEVKVFVLLNGHTRTF